MAEDVTELLTGGVVIAVAAGFLFYTAQTAGIGGGPSGSYPLTASFRSIEGVQIGTDVRLAGVKIGAVSDLELNAETFRADATFAIRDGVDLPVDTAVIVASEGLLGGNYIELLPGGMLDNLQAGDEIEDTQSSISLINLLLKFVSGGDSE
ncbi:MAG: outer membrane lipid asymmetry maintenance protein MlaD [Rhodobacteraceae bacterium]|nr:outer membrane lipid asymmetry maintenance protein MlaD [Paracoccaceae bacterium]